jgi:hypothetical protein
MMKHARPGAGDATSLRFGARKGIRLVESVYIQRPALDQKGGSRRIRWKAPRSAEEAGSVRIHSEH